MHARATGQPPGIGRRVAACWVDDPRSEHGPSASTPAYARLASAGCAGRADHTPADRPRRSRQADCAAQALRLEARVGRHARPRRQPARLRQPRSGPGAGRGAPGSMKPDSGASIRQTAPPGGRSSVAAPPTVAAKARPIKRVPKPSRVPGLTAGPPLSRHTKARVGSAPPAAIDHAMSTVPSAEESAPYLAAFVASSCSAKASMSAGRAPTATSGPDTRKRPPRPPSCGSTAPRTSADMLAPPVAGPPASRMSWALPMARKRSSRADRAPSRSPAPRSVWAATAWTTARMFFRRWPSSRARSSWHRRSAASAASRAAAASACSASRRRASKSAVTCRARASRPAACASVRPPGRGSVSMTHSVPTGTPPRA